VKKSMMWPFLILLGVLFWMFKRMPAMATGTSGDTGGSGTGGGSGTSGGSGTTADVSISDIGGKGVIKTAKVDAVALDAYRKKTATREQLLQLGKPFVYEALANVYGPAYKSGLTSSNFPGPFSKNEADFFLAAKTAAQADSGFPVSPYGSLGPYNTTTKRYGYAIVMMTKYGRPKILNVE
jgi:hypothetical protein